MYFKESTDSTVCTMSLLKDNVDDKWDYSKNNKIHNWEEQIYFQANNKQMEKSQLTDRPHKR